MKIIAEIKRELIFQNTKIYYRDEWPNGAITWITDENMTHWVEVSGSDKEFLEITRRDIKENGEK